MTQPNTRPQPGVRRYAQLKPGWEKCYECMGDGTCVTCDGTGKEHDQPCRTCGATGLCPVCGGEGQVSPAKKLLEWTGVFRELGFEGHPNAPSVKDARGKRGAAHKVEVVAYLSSGKMMSFSPGGWGKDVFDSSRRTAAQAILTDGTYAWYRELAYYVEHYDVALPEAFERHMAANDYRVPSVDTGRIALFEV